MRLFNEFIQAKRPELRPFTQSHVSIETLSRQYGRTLTRQGIRELQRQYHQYRMEKHGMIYRQKYLPILEEEGLIETPIR